MFLRRIYFYPIIIFFHIYIIIKVFYVEIVKSPSKYFINKSQSQF